MKMNKTYANQVNEMEQYFTEKVGTEKGEQKKGTFILGHRTENYVFECSLNLGEYSFEYASMDGVTSELVFSSDFEVIKEAVKRLGLEIGGKDQ